MATAALPDPVFLLARQFAALFDLAKEIQKVADIMPVYEAIASHLRSAAPMALVGVPPIAEPQADTLIDLGSGQLIRLRVIDGKVNLFVCEGPNHDANVALDAEARGQLVAALGAVR